MKYTIEQLNQSNKDFFITKSKMTSNYDFIDDFVKDESTLLFFVRNETEVCGVIYGYVLARMNSKPMMYIHSVDVYEEYRRKGIATLMINTMIEYAKTHDLLKVFLITNKSNDKV